MRAYLRNSILSPAKGGGFAGLQGLTGGAQTAAYRAGLARVTGGTGRARVLGLGPSNMRGWLAGTGAAGQTDARRHGWFYKLAARLAARGIPANGEAVMGAGNGTGISAGDEAAIALSGWIVTTNTRNGPGGRPYSRTSAPNVLTYQPGPSYPFNTVEIMDQMDASLGNWRWKIADVVANGAYSAAISTAGTPALRKTTVSTGAPAAAQNLFVDKSGNVVCYLQGFIAYDAAVPAVDFVCMGWPGSSYSNWLSGRTTVAYSPLAGLPTLAAPGQAAADLVIVQMGLQEYLTEGLPSDLKASARTLIDFILAQGSTVLMVTPSPPNEAAYSGRAWAPYAEALIAAGLEAGVPVYDTRHVIPAWRSDLYYDNVHGLDVATVILSAGVDDALQQMAAA